MGYHVHLADLRTVGSGIMYAVLPSQNTANGAGYVTGEALPGRDMTQGTHYHLVRWEVIVSAKQDSTNSTAVSTTAKTVNPAENIMMYTNI
jgi:hypothetical protein